MKSVCYRIPLSKLLTLTFYIITTITSNWDLNRRVKSWASDIAYCKVYVLLFVMKKQTKQQSRTNEL